MKMNRKFKNFEVVDQQKYEIVMGLIENLFITGAWLM